MPSWTCATGRGRRGPRRRIRRTVAVRCLRSWRRWARCASWAPRPQSASPPISRTAGFSPPCSSAPPSSTSTRAPRAFPAISAPAVSPSPPDPRVTDRAGAALAVALITVALGFLALVAWADPPPAPPWESALGREHPLTARIWEPTSGRFVTAAALATRLAAARFVLLGEKHDNADHHRLQAWLLRELLGAGRRPAVAFEMFSVDDDATIARQRASTPLDAAALARAVDWSRSGWPDFRLYEPIVRAALEAGVPVVGANLSRAVTQTVRRGGIGALDPAVRARLGLERGPPPEASIALFAEIRRNHRDAI